MISRPTDHRDNRSQRATPADPVPILTCAYSHVYLIMNANLLTKGLRRQNKSTRQKYVVDMAFQLTLTLFNQLVFGDSLFLHRCHRCTACNLNYLLALP